MGSAYPATSSTAGWKSAIESEPFNLRRWWLSHPQAARVRYVVLAILLMASIILAFLEQGWALGVYLLVKMLWKAPVVERKIPEPALDLLEGNPQATLAQVRFLYVQRLYGEDFGLISFEDGFLVFDGLATSFRLKAQDLASFDPHGTVMAGSLPDGTSLSIYLLESGREAVNLTVFGLRIQNWHEAQALAEGASLYPPRSPRSGSRDPESMPLLYPLLMGMFVALILAAGFAPNDSRRGAAMNMPGYRLFMVFVGLLFLVLLVVLWLKERRQWRKVLQRS